MASTDELCEYAVENDKLKKQLEETFKNYKKEAYIVNKQTRQLTDEYENTKCQSDKVKSLLTQQKEFIKYLEDELEKDKKNPYARLSEYGMNRIHIYKEILQKYKEIVGVSDEK